MSIGKNTLILIVLLLVLVLVENANADESDIDISSIRYTNDFVNGESVTIVSSGKDEATEYKYNFYDDDDEDCDVQDCVPENWFDTDFDDTGWGHGVGSWNRSQGFDGAMGSRLS